MYYHFVAYVFNKACFAFMLVFYITGSCLISNLKATDNRDLLWTDGDIVAGKVPGVYPMPATSRR